MQGQKRALAAIGLMMLSGCAGLGGDGGGSSSLYRPNTGPAVSVASAPVPTGTRQDEELRRLTLRLDALETALGGLRRRITEEETRASAEGGALARDLSALASEHAMLADDVDGMSVDLDRLFARVDALEALARRAAEDAAALRLLANRSELQSMGDAGAGIVPETGQRFAVHLASYRDRDSARAGWKTLVGRYEKELAGLEPHLDPLDLGGGDSGWLRLIAGPIGDVQPARAICETLQKTGSYCQVTVWRGMPLED